MKFNVALERVKNKVIYTCGVHFPYSKIRCFSLRMLGYQVGKNVYFPSDLVITQNFTGERGILKIGNNVSIGPRCTLVVMSHPNYSKIRNSLKNPEFKIVIEDNVWLGAGVIILPGVIIGENSIIAAGAVVTKNVEKNSIMGGVPAKLIKK